jgi:hypothetical protein
MEVMVTAKATASISFRMPTVLRTASLDAVHRDAAKNQTDHILRSAHRLVAAFRHGAKIKSLRIPAGRCALEADDGSAMVTIRALPKALDIVTDVATRLWQPTTRLLLWGMSLTAPPDEIDVEQTVPRAVRVQMPRQIEKIIQGVTQDIPLFCVEAVERLLGQIDDNVEARTLLLPRGLWRSTTRNLPTAKIQSHALPMPPDLIEDVFTTAPRFYRSFNSFVVWASLLAATEK